MREASMSHEQHFIEPLDVLYLRGNRLFGAPGSFSESLIPPWPSVAAGALRSALLLDRGYELERFARGEIDDAELGTPQSPRSFTLTGFQLGRRHADGRVEPLFAVPADLEVEQSAEGTLAARRVAPSRPAHGIMSSAVTDALAVLPQPQRAKPETGRWLTASGWQRYLDGRPIRCEKDLVSRRELWRVDTRVGIGLDRGRRSAAQGKLFTTEAIALRLWEHAPSADGARFDVGFITHVAGARLPDRLDLRLGGDGRGAVARRVTADWPVPDYDAIAEAGRCRLVLTAPGVFEGGWRPTGTIDTGNGLDFELHGVTGRLVCASVPRGETISGFDLAQRRPKPAQRVAPTGSVYWLEDVDASPHALRKLSEGGLWTDPLKNDPRRAEGFNRVAVAAW